MEINKDEKKEKSLEEMWIGSLKKIITQLGKENRKQRKREK